MKYGNFLLMLTAFVFCGCADKSDIPSVSGFDAARYMGKWYEYARLPNWFEKGMTKVCAEYSLGQDGSIKVLNSGIRNGKEKSVVGKARFASDAEETGELEVSFFGPFYSPYRIIKLAEDYRYSVVMGSDAGYLWILSRTSELSPKDEKEIMAFLKNNDFAADELIFSFKQPSASQPPQNSGH